MASEAKETWNPALYAHLRRAAGALFRRERPNGLLQPTALLHEAYLRVSRGIVSPKDRTRFFAAAVGEMRRVLVDQARRRNAVKNGRGCKRLPLDTRVLALAQPTVDLTELHDALDRLATLSPRQSRVVELRFLAGMSEDEAAEVLGVSRRTVQQDWRGAKAWLKRELADTCEATERGNSVLARRASREQSAPAADTSR
ncbi:MAG: hypothetical protein CHACPFDD_00855 [Phycisphaerae bacterium]|nr:hypothetical protein [Phycisphaerae bacterium]